MAISTDNGNTSPGPTRSGEGSNLEEQFVFNESLIIMSMLLLLAGWTKSKESIESSTIVCIHFLFGITVCWFFQSENVSWRWIIESWDQDCSSGGLRDDLQLYIFFEGTMLELPVDDVGFAFSKENQRRSLNSLLSTLDSKSKLSTLYHYIQSNMVLCRRSC